jgi:hypothetical protein
MCSKDDKLLNIGTEFEKKTEIAKINHRFLFTCFNAFFLIELRQKGSK